MDTKAIRELHIRMHKLMHPFDHIAHGALIFAIFFLIKTIIGLFKKKIDSRKHNSSVFGVCYNDCDKCFRRAQIPENRD